MCLDADKIVSGDALGTVVVTSRQTLQPVRQFHDHVGWVTGLHMDATTLVSGATNDYINIYDFSL